jgi:hypothetical protein
MKKRLFIQATLISILFLALMGAIVYWNIISWNKRMNDLASVPPRRYIDLSRWHNVDRAGQELNFFQASLLQFDSIFMKTLYLLVILQYFFLLKKLKIKNGFLIVGCLLSSVVGGFFTFTGASFHEYFVTGLNPYLALVPVFFLLLQLTIWIYLNMFLFKKSAEINSER